MNAIGDRVGAMVGSDGLTVTFLGYGKYVGDEVPETAVGWIAEMLQEAKIPNPKIELDNGKVVWGCECWWDAESRMTEKIEGYRKRDYEIIQGDIDQIRSDFKLNE